MLRIGIIGPESTGKSTLANQLAGVLQASVVPEYARDYVEQLSRPYTYDDVVLIAKKQIEQLSADYPTPIVIFDTELIITKVWFEHKYSSASDSNTASASASASSSASTSASTSTSSSTSSSTSACPQFIEDYLLEHPLDHYLLLSPDLPFVPDPVRENPDLRLQLFDRYLALLRHYRLPYTIISGTGATRLQAALDAINNLIKQQSENHPAESLPAQGLPAQNLPAQGLPVQSLSAQSLSAQSLSVQGLSAQNPPAQSLSAESLSAENTTSQTPPTDTSSQWQWQKSGTSWKGVGLYHLTLTLPNRQPLLGELIIPDDDPCQAFVKASELGNVLLECHRHIPDYHTEIQLLHYCLMPDHLHSIWYVRQPMPISIRQAAQGFWRAAKKIGRAYTYLTNIPAQTSPQTYPQTSQQAVSQAVPFSSIASAASREQGQRQEQEQSQELRLADALGSENTLRSLLGDEAYYSLCPLFTEVPFIRPMSHRSQLPATIRYIDMNPQRLATKRLMPGFFRVQQGIEIGGRQYDGVGNITLLQSVELAPVHVRRTMVEDAERHGSPRLRDYMNGCIIKARKGCLMVSPFISPHEKQIMQVLLKEQHPFILLTDNGFRDYYKPADCLFDACASGRLLILSPWQHDDDKRHISRADCIALNGMAEEICTAINSTNSPSNSPNNSPNNSPTS